MNTAKKLMLGLLRGSGAAAPAFSPTDIAGLVLWLDASDSATLFQASNGTTPATADNDVVGYWADKSTNARHATQGTTANKPLLKLAIQNSKNVLRFDGTDDFIETATFADIAQPYTVISVNNFTNSTNQVAYDGIDVGRRHALAIEPLIYAINSGANLSASPATAPATQSVWSVTFNGASSIIRQNAIELKTGNAGADALRDMRVGWNAQKSVGYAFQSDMAEVLVYTSLSDANRLLVESYLASKWGI